MNLITYTDPIGLLLGSWSSGINLYSVLLRYALSFFCAAIIGCERAHKRHSAGLRTFILVSITAASAMMLDIYYSSIISSVGFPVISAACLVGIAIISGNSFLYSSKNQIKGLTTAVALWGIAFVGLSFGGGFYTAAITGFAAFFVALSLLQTFESFLIDRSNHFEVHLELTNVSHLQHFITTIRRIGLKIDNIEMNPAYVHSGLSVYSVSFTITREELKKYKKHSEIIEALGTLDYVYHIEELF